MGNKESNIKFDEFDNMKIKGNIYFEIDKYLPVKEQYKNIIQKYTQETDKIVENAINHIFSKTASEMLSKLALKWNDMTDNEKKETAKEFAGTYQSGRFLILMSELSKSWEINLNE